MQYIDLVNYKNAESEQDLDKYTTLILEAHFDQQQKEEWAKKIKNDFGVFKPNERKETKTSSLHKYLWLISGIVAIITLLWIKLPLIKQSTKSTDQFVTAELSQQLPYFGRRKGVDNDNKIRQQAYDNYQQKRFGRAIENFDALDQKNKLTKEDFLYYALSYLYKEDYNKAIFHLEEISKRENFPSHTHWYLSLAYYQNGQKGLAKKVLEKHIALGDKGIKRQKAKDLLKRLQKEE